ncbi:MAG: VOC family protein [Candidatus Kapabacteria bacterium]|nr:VOC family protein [Candidatus Kapabacteria bacterium]
MQFPSSAEPQSTTKPQQNPIVHCEIPVTNLDRAEKFYRAVFGFDFTREQIDGNEMAHFPLHEGISGVSGSLAKGEIYKPSTTGTLVYFQTTSIDETLRQANTNGGKTLYPKTSVGANNFVAEIQDSEGNRIALLQRGK